MVPQGVEMVRSIDSPASHIVENKEIGENEQSPASHAVNAQETDILLGASSTNAVSLSISEDGETGNVYSTVTYGSDSLAKEKDATVKQRLKDFAVYTFLLGLAGFFAFIALRHLLQ